MTRKAGPNAGRKRTKPLQVPDRPARNGGMFITANYGNRGGGRPPDEFKRAMREMASSDEALAYLERCLNGDEGALVAVQAQKYVAERGYGKVPIQVTGDAGGPLSIEVTRRIVKVDGAT